ncbi:protein MAIN-LIKE 1-like [Rhododendron vialii]|uniref:protein MAIN-LIKE 1-like n=1 Tax=Rhododendron vialii TaxID=182163 RepID=UPI00265F53F3|nr:protein MAIN-LIKE 1-like [Rhododendron vialii]
MKRTRPTISARKRKANQTLTSEVGEVGGKGRRQRQKKVVIEAREEENRPEVEQQVKEDAIKAEEEARPDAQAEEDEARPDGQAEEEAGPDAQMEEEARTDAHIEAVEPEAERHEDDAHTEASIVRRGRRGGRQQRQRHDEVPVGPEVPSLLKDFRNHVAADIWNGRERQLLKIYNHSRYLKIWELPTTNRRFMGRVTASGLLPLAQITYKYCNKVLVSSFVERWHPETNSFHFGFGEMTITLEDVLYLVGLPVEGLVVHVEVHSREDCVALVHRCLGVTMDEASDVVSCGGVELHWLKNKFMNVGNDATDERVDYCVRAFLLYLLGTTLFVDKTGIRVNVSYLALAMFRLELG